MSDNNIEFSKDGVILHNINVKEAIRMLTSITESTNFYFKDDKTIHKIINPSISDISIKIDGSIKEVEQLNESKKKYVH